MGSQLVRARRELGRGFICWNLKRISSEMEVTSFCEARPAITPGYETNVEDEENGK